MQLTQCAMGKQAMGNIAYNQLNRMDTQSNKTSTPPLATHTVCHGQAGPMGNIAYNQLNRMDTLLYLLC